MTVQDTKQAAARLAREARQRANRSTEQTTHEIHRQLNTLAPELVESLGTPMDPNQGYGPDSERPAGLPAPGSAPGGELQRRAGNIFEGPDATRVEQAHEAPPVQAPAQAPQPVRTAQPGAPARVEHAVLSRLREDLGVEQIDPIDVTVGGHTWTMVPLTPGDLASAARLADGLAVGEVERQLTWQTATAAHAVIAVDHIPTWQVMGVDVAPGTHVTNPLRPPRGMRIMAASLLFDFITEKTKTQTADKLYAAYVDRVDSSGMVASYMDDPGNQKVRYRCEETGCDHEVVETPRMAKGKRVAPFCQYHGSPMAEVGVHLPGPLT